MKTEKSYEIKEVAEILGISKQRITQKLNGYTRKERRHAKKEGGKEFYYYKYNPVLQEKIDFFYDRTRIKITAAGLKKLKKQKAAA